MRASAGLRICKTCRLWREDCFGGLQEDGVLDLFTRCSFEGVVDRKRVDALRERNLVVSLCPVGAKRHHKRVGYHRYDERTCRKVPQIGGDPPWLIPKRWAFAVQDSDRDQGNEHHREASGNSKPKLRAMCVAL